MFKLYTILPLDTGRITDAFADQLRQYVGQIIRWNKLQKEWLPKELNPQSYRFVYGQSDDLSITLACTHQAANIILDRLTSDASMDKQLILTQEFINLKAGIELDGFGNLIPHSPRNEEAADSPTEIQLTPGGTHLITPGTNSAVQFRPDKYSLVRFRNGSSGSVKMPNDHTIDIESSGVVDISIQHEKYLVKATGTGTFNINGCHCLVIDGPGRFVFDRASSGIPLQALGERTPEEYYRLSLFERQLNEWKYDIRNYEIGWGWQHTSERFISPGG